MYTLFTNVNLLSICTPQMLTQSEISKLLSLSPCLYCTTIGAYIMYPIYNTVLGT